MASFWVVQLNETAAEILADFLKNPGTDSPDSSLISRAETTTGFYAVEHQVPNDV